MLDILKDAAVFLLFHVYSKNLVSKISYSVRYVSCEIKFQPIENNR